MLNRLAVATAVLLVVARSPVAAAERDYLRRGEEKLTAEHEIKYDRAVRYILSRAWKNDVVLRMSVIPSFQPEIATGIAHTPHGYIAFDVTVADNIWYQLGFGSEAWKQNYSNYRRIKPILHERRLSNAVSVRVAAIFRRVLTDRRNYRRDESSVDTTLFAYYLAFLPDERLSAYVAHTREFGPQTEQLIAVAGALGQYAGGAPERELLKAVTEAERKLGI